MNQSPEDYSIVGDQIIQNEYERLGLNEDPFKISTDIRFLYLGMEHLYIYKQIQGIIEKRRGIGAVYGEKGTGKSSLAIRVFTTYFDQDGFLVAYIPTGTAFSSAMAAAKLVSLNFPSLDIKIERSYSAQLEAFKAGVARASEKNINLVLLIDDAQEISTDALKFLLELYNFDVDKKLFQVVLFGQYELYTKLLTKPAVQARVFRHLEMGPISIESMIKMVNHRLSVAGRRETLFDLDALGIIYNSSGGIPRVIIRICAVALDEIIRLNQSVITKDIAAFAAQQVVESEINAKRISEKIQTNKK